MLEVKNLTKKFKLNKKQMAERKTSNNYLTAVDDLSFE
ncbi:MAG: ABC transporter ATP-binding protein, partial [Bacilli bacterium]|nr:ABC transporter ATP-binding protein [Bacilli bacterium]